jgi:hypothetical protein
VQGTLFKDDREANEEEVIVRGLRGRLSVGACMAYGIGQSRLCQVRGDQRTGQAIEPSQPLLTPHTGQVALMLIISVEIFTSCWRLLMKLVVSSPSSSPAVSQVALPHFLLENQFLVIE